MDWKSICDRATPAKGRSLIFIPPVKFNRELMAKVLHFEIRANEEKWKFMILGYVIGAKPYYAHLLSFA